MEMRKGLMAFVCNKMKIDAERNGKVGKQRFYAGGIEIEVRSDLPIAKDTFAAKFHSFRADLETSGSNDQVILNHHFFLPEIRIERLGEPVYQQAPWAIYRPASKWVYMGILPEGSGHDFHRIAIFSADHACGHIFSPSAQAWETGGLHSLTLFPTDQILLARLLADRDGVILHSAAMEIGGRGFVFLGHSEAGKSTTVTQLRGMGTILCDDRNIVRREYMGFRLYGTWSHGDVPEVSGSHSPRLGALFFLRQSRENRAIPLPDKAEVFKRLVPLVVRPLATSGWWQRVMETMENMVRTVPAYELRLDKSGEVRGVLEQLLGNMNRGEGGAK